MKFPRRAVPLGLKEYAQRHHPNMRRNAVNALDVALWQAENERYPYSHPPGVICMNHWAINGSRPSLWRRFILFLQYDHRTFLSNGDFLCCHGLTDDGWGATIEVREQRS